MQPIALLLLSCSPLTEFAAISVSELRSELAQFHAVSNSSNSKAINYQNFTWGGEKHVNKEAKSQSCKLIRQSQQHLAANLNPNSF